MVKTKLCAGSLIQDFALGEMLRWIIQPQNTPLDRDVRHILATVIPLKNCPIITDSVTGFRVGVPVSVEHRSPSVCSVCLRQVGHRGTHRPLHNWVGH